MAIAKRPRNIDDIERARDMPEVEAASLTTVALTMFLSVLAEAEAAKQQRDATELRDDSAQVPAQDLAQAALPPVAADHAAETPPDPSLAPPADHLSAAGAPESPPAPVEIVSPIEPSQIKE